MIKAAIEKIQELSQPVISVIEGHTFAIHGETATELRPTLDFPQTLGLCSLDALVKLVKTEALQRYETPIYISIPSPGVVACYSQPYDEEGRFERVTYYEAHATDVPGWSEKVQLPFEEAMIALRTRFQPTPDTDYAIKLLSEITTGAKVTFNDNGVATTVVTRKGIDLQSNQAIKPIVALRPYRTFQEVEQPVSQFLIRISERGISFIEADGGMWKLHARQTVKAYLEDALADEIHDGKVVAAL
nr:MAG TPA: hypothetical protein [Caudoviricetes sp.]